MTKCAKPRTAVEEGGSKLDDHHKELMLLLRVIDTFSQPQPVNREPELPNRKRAWFYGARCSDKAQRRALFFPYAYHS